MRSLLNMNLPGRLCNALEAAGHEAVHVRDLGMAESSDDEITRRAVRDDAVILTHDLDYGALLAFSGDRRPSVVIFRVRHAAPANLVDRFQAAWRGIEEPLSAGAVVVIEDAAVRVRRLPIGRTDG